MTKQSDIPESAAAMDEHEIELGVDWGTWKCIIAYAILRNGVRAGPILPVAMPGGVYEVPMMATWIDKRLVYGTELLSEANKDPKLADKIIDLFKLPLYRSAETSEISARVEKILSELPGEKTLDMLIAEHIRAVVVDAKKSILNGPEEKRFGRKKLAKMLRQAKVRITVPEMWTPDARCRMQAAAKNAGLSFVTLASEPKCALAYLLDRAAQGNVELDREVGKGDRTIVVDLGCGTGDFVKGETLDYKGVQGRIKTIGYSSGDLCGSSQVDRALLETLQNRMGRDWKVQAVWDLGITDPDFERRALLAIEKVKTEFRPNDEYGIGTIRGIGRTRVTFDLSRDEMHSALDKVISRIVSKLDVLAIDPERRKADVELIEVTGGFAKSSYLMDALRERYGKYGIMVKRPNDNDTGNCFPVALGSLLRYDNISSQPLPQQYGYAMLRREEFDPQHHPDAYELDDDEEIVYKPWVSDSPYDPEDPDVVEDRLFNIMAKGTVLEADEQIRVEAALEYRLPEAHPCITDEFVYTTRTIRDHAAAAKHFDESTGNYTFHAHIHPWRRVEVRLDRADLQAMNCTVVTSKDGEKFWKFRARVVIRAREEAMQIGYEVLKPVQAEGKSKKRKKGGSSGFEGEVAFRVIDTIWEASHSEFLE